MSHVRSTKLLKTALAGVLGIGLLFSTGCSSRAVEAEQSASGDQITLTDQRGEEVVIAGPVEEAAITVMPAPSIFAAVDGSYDRIAGINQSTLVANQQGMFSTIFPESAESAVVAGSDFIPNVETLLELDPDVVIQWGDRGTEVTKPIEDAGFPVLGLDYGTHEDLQTWIRMFGQVLEKSDRAEEIIRWQDATQAEIGNRVAAMDTPAPRTMILSLAEGTYSTTSASGYDGFQLPMAGAEMITENFLSEEGQINPEQIIEWDPEVILLSGFDDSTPEDIYNDKRLASTTAVKEKRVYKNPLGAYRWQVPSAESPLFWQWLNEVLYPNQEIAAEESLRSRVKAAMAQLYGFEISEEQIDQVLRFDLNGGAANYEQFNR